MHRGFSCFNRFCVCRLLLPELFWAGLQQARRGRKTTGSLVIARGKLPVVLSS